MKCKLPQSTRRPNKTSLSRTRSFDQIFEASNVDGLTEVEIEMDETIILMLRRTFDGKCFEKGYKTVIKLNDPIKVTRVTFKYSQSFIKFTRRTK